MDEGKAHAVHKLNRMYIIFLYQYIKMYKILRKLVFFKY